MKRRAVKEVYLNLSKSDSDSENKLIVVQGPPIFGHERTYRVRYYDKQQDALLKLADILYSEDEKFPGQLAKADSNHKNNSQRRTRYAAEEKTKLPGRTVREVEGIFIEVGLNMGQKYTLAKVMCGAVDVPFSRKRSIEI